MTTLSDQTVRGITHCRTESTAALDLRIASQERSAIIGDLNLGDLLLTFVGVR
jgi:hypothetical protein